MTGIKKFLPLFILICLSLLAWSLGLQHYLSFDVLKTHQQELEAYITSHLLLSILIYMTIYIAIVSLSIPGATFMTLTGGFLFGQWAGTGSTVIAATLGASILFLSARLASQDLIARKAGPFIAKMQKGFQENALSYLLTLRLIPLFPFVAINLVAAFLQISFPIFFFGTLIGIIPGTFIYISIGVGLREVIQQPNFSPHVILEPKILMALGGLGILSLLPVLYKWLQKKRSPRS